MEYSQQLEDYATQLEQQTKQWQQKVKDTAKPFSDFYNKAPTLMKKGMDLYQYSTNLA
jgi:GTP-dependent phosphoenolpyruvate carboxykinase